MNRFHRISGALLAAALAVGALAGCGGGDDGAACGSVQREPLDRRFLQHVIGEAADVEYASDPPTSGPHTPSPPIDAVQSSSIPRPVQVGILEEGRVLVQYRGLDAADRAAVEGLAGDRVVVAPAEDLPDDAAVVATAWLHKQVCTSVDTDTLERFVADHEGNGPGADG